VGESILLPLSAEPDDLLMHLLRASKHVKGYCHSVEPLGANLLMYPSKVGWSDPGDMLTAITAVLDTSNNQRVERERMQEEESDAAAEERRERVDAALKKWWDQRQ
jgi:hypothetical protein